MTNPFNPAAQPGVLNPLGTPESAGNILQAAGISSPDADIYNVTHSNPNCTLQYGSNVAQLRCTTLGITYSVNSTQSHSRQYNAFYPHRRSQGTFTMGFACKGWNEYQLLNKWFQTYTRTVLSAAQTPPAITASLPSRNFIRLGYPTTGMEFGDHVGSMVFNVTISFISANDPNDPSTSLLKPSDVSETNEPANALATTYFYPNSTVNSPGAMEQYLYGASTGAITSGSLVGIVADSQAEQAAQVAKLNRLTT